MTILGRQWVDKYHWTPKTRLVVGVSGGVDSMVLLSTLLQLPKEVRPVITVAHINHQLREESNEEEDFLRRFCKNHELEMYSIKWKDGARVVHAIENKAREFRYQFFQSVMEKTGSSVLLTAHHQDDDVETVLMRLIQGAPIRSLGGIQEKRVFPPGVLIRPLLDKTKSELYHLARQEDVPYMEDETNQHGTYFRNRIRKTILPLLNTENPKFGEGLLRLSSEVTQQHSALQELIQPVYESCVTEREQCFEVDLNVFNALSEAIKIQICEELCQNIQTKTGILIGFSKKELLFSILTSQSAHKLIDLGHDWLGEKNYQKFNIMKKTVLNQSNDVIHLGVNQGIYLSENEWIGLFEASRPLGVLFDESWCEDQLLYEYTKNHHIQIRKREDGDKFIYNQQGQTKKVSRFFIDEKIPIKKRQESWIVLDEKSNVLWVLPFRKSYLSIPNETDKIQYKLVYFKKKDR